LFLDAQEYQITESFPSIKTDIKYQTKR